MENPDGDGLSTWKKLCPKKVDQNPCKTPLILTLKKSESKSLCFLVKIGLREVEMSGSNSSVGNEWRE